jgi:hypothetical protein
MIKVCPVCGNAPIAVCYTSYPPKYGYKHCGIHGGYNENWHEAETEWNEEVERYTQNNLPNFKEENGNA